MFIEIVGLAGSGKTTLTRRLIERDARMLPGKRLRPRSAAGALYFIRHSPLLAPVLLRCLPGGRRLSAEEVKKLVYLRGWYSVLRRQADNFGADADANADAIVLLDQGPIFNLATLYGFGPERLRQQQFARWWECTARRWAALLDSVIVLDAADQVLYERVQKRETWHLLKNASGPQTDRFLSTYRCAFEAVFELMAGQRQLAIRRYDTGGRSPDQLADQILGDLGLCQNADRAARSDTRTQQGQRRVLRPGRRLPYPLRR